MSRIAVVGAGILGLVAGLRLTQRGHDVVVLERAERGGGLASSFDAIPGADPIERFYHHIFKSDRSMIALIGELGLGDRLVWKKPVAALLYEGELEQLDSAVSLLRFSKLPVVDRLRMAVAMAILKASPTAVPFEGQRATAWLRRVAGDHAYEVVFGQVFESKFGPHANRISLAWFWARIHDRTTQLGYVDGGFDAVYARLVQRIRDAGGCVSFDDGVENIERRGGGFAVTSPRSGTAEFDQVLATIPLRTLARLAPELPASYVGRYEPDAGLRARCLILALDRPLTDVYWINVSEKNFPFMVVVEHTNFVDPVHYAGNHIVYFGNYGVDFPRVSPALLIDEFLPFIRAINPHFERSWIRDAWLFGAPDSQPIITPGYRNRIAPVRTVVPGLYAANLNQIYPHDRGQNYSVELAESTAATIDSDVRHARSWSVGDAADRGREPESVPLR